MIPASALKVMHVLLCSQGSLSLRDLARESGVPLSICSRHVNDLKHLGYLAKRPRLRVISGEMVYLMAYARPLRSLRSEEFETLHRAQYLIGEIPGIARLGGTRLEYAYTHLAGAELLAPYVVPDQVHAYVKEDQLPEWREALEGSGIYPGRNGAVHLVTSELDPFYGAQEVRGLRVVSTHLLYSDLYSCGGREREAARFLAEATGLDL